MKKFILLVALALFLTTISCFGGTSCSSGFYLSGAVCTVCPAGCSTCKAGPSCTACSAPFVLVKLATGANKCFCPNGLFYNPITLSCISCSGTIPNCLSCTTITSPSLATSCAACAAGYFQTASSPATCSPCSLYCTSCTSAATCSKCISSTFTIVSGNCVCNTAMGLVFNSATSTCVTCSTAIPKCLTCSSMSPVTCTVCQSGYYYDGSGCLVCPTYCTSCNDPMSCTGCVPGANLAAGACVPVMTCTPGFSPSCLTCDLVQCFTCQIGYFLDLGINDCLPCGSQCLQCVDSSTKCTACYTSQNRELAIGDICSPISGFYDSGNDIADPCDPNCLACVGASTSCNQCIDGMFLDSASACSNCPFACAKCTDILTCTDCLPTFVIIGGLCVCDNAMNLFFDGLVSCLPCTIANCLACISLTICNSCSSGYLVDASNQCSAALPTTSSCGDGIWLDPMEACDDGNLNNNDGCDSQCQIETDYSCLVADKLPSGESLCKYTKDITADFSYLQKDASSNIVHLFFDLQPPTFKNWDQQMIEDLLMPVEIVDQTTGAVTVIPYNSMTFAFRQNSLTNQAEITIDYGQSTLEDSYLKFNVDPTQTSNPSIQDLSVQSNLYVKLNSGRNGVNLYGYSQETYDFQEKIQLFSMLIGLVSLAMLFIGLFVPAGKLIILQALAVVQITFFSILQFEKVPPTFLGLKNLILSSGYNNFEAFSSPAYQSKLQNSYNLMGLSYETLSNYNISLIAVFLLPFSVGLLGLALIKLISRTKPQNIESDALKAKDQSQKSLWKQIFKRLLFETSFYGLLICGYLVWISIFQSISSSYFTKAENLVYSVIVLCLWVSYSVLILKVETKKVDLNQLSHQKVSLSNSNNSLLTNFSDFSSIYNQISKSTDQNAFDFQKSYIVFVFERIIVSAIIILVPSQFNYSSVLIISVFLVFVIALILLNAKSGEKLPEKERKSLFSYLYKNYVLRQLINFTTIILVQGMLLVTQIVMSSDGVQNTVLQNQLIIKIVPLTILCLLMLNLIFNIFLWVWQLKEDKLLSKMKQSFEILTSNQKGKQSDEPQATQIRDKLLDKENEFKSAKIQRKNTKSIKGSLDEQQIAMQDALNNYISNSGVLKIRNSPFVACLQKKDKNQILNLIKKSKRKVKDIQQPYQSQFSKIGQSNLQESQNQNDGKEESKTKTKQSSQVQAQAQAQCKNQEMNAEKIEQVLVDKVQAKKLWEDI